MIKSRKFRLIAALMVLTLAITVFSSCGNNSSDPIETTPSTEATQSTVPTSINRLTGLELSDSSAQNKRPVAVVVENSPEARPQWSLCTPDIVVEGLAEGGITRMLWLYSDISNVGKIGPTRSARHNFVEVAAGFDAIYVHFGGSYAAYNLFSSDSSINHIDGNKAEGSYFKRDSSRKAPHNAYTTGEWITNAIEDKNFRTDIKSGYETPFSFSSEKRTLSNACSSIEMEFSTNYKHTFTYNSADGLYYNNMNSKAMVDSDGNQMAVSNVIVIYSNVGSYKGDEKLVEWNLTSGKGIYISNGSYEEITWKKGSTHSALELYSSDGSELKLNTGKSYIGFVPSSNSSKTVIS